MNVLNFARICWQLKDYSFKDSSFYIINNLKGHSVFYSNIQRADIESIRSRSIDDYFYKDPLIKRTWNKKIEVQWGLIYVFAKWLFLFMSFLKVLLFC